jgi:hypothetical protein
MGGVAGTAAIIESQFPGGADFFGGNTSNNRVYAAGNNDMMPPPAQQHPHHHQQQATIVASPQQQQRQYLQQGQGQPTVRQQQQELQEMQSTRLHYFQQQQQHLQQGHDQGQGHGQHTVRQQELQSIHMQQQQQQQDDVSREFILQRLSFQDLSQGSAKIDTRYMQQHQQQQHQQQQQHHYNHHQLQQMHQQQQRNRLHGCSTEDGMPAEPMRGSMPGSMANESLMDASFRRALTKLVGSQYTPAMSQFGSIESLAMAIHNQSNLNTGNSGTHQNLNLHNTKKDKQDYEYASTSS